MKLTTKHPKSGHTRTIDAFTCQAHKKDEKPIHIHDTPAAREQRTVLLISVESALLPRDRSVAPNTATPVAAPLAVARRRTPCSVLYSQDTTSDRQTASTPHRNKHHPQRFSEASARRSRLASCPTQMRRDIQPYLCANPFAAHPRLFALSSDSCSPIYAAF